MALALCYHHNDSFSVFQRLAINITPMEEHESIRQTHKVSRFRCRHWLYV
jgi:hypothetical protein